VMLLEVRGNNNVVAGDVRRWKSERRIVFI
jgi:hypothetical protein